MASFLFLTHLPTYSLLSFFYGIRPTSALIAYGVTIVSTALPFALLRRPSSVHDLSRAPADAVAHRNILQDKTITIFTTLLATSVFSVVLYASYATWLPTQLVIHFEGLPDISAAHAGPAGLPVLFLTLLPAGWAARDFYLSALLATHPLPVSLQAAARVNIWLQLFVATLGAN